MIEATNDSSSREDSYRTEGAEKLSVQVGGSEETSANYLEGLSWEEKKQVADFLRTSHSKEWREEFGERTSEVDRYMERGEASRSMEEIFGGKREVKPKEMLNALLARHEVSDRLLEQDRVASMAGPYADDYRKIKEKVEREYMSSTNGNDPRAAAAMVSFVALERFGSRFGDDSALRAHDAAADSLFGIEQPNRAAPTAMRGDTNKGLSGVTARPLERVPEGEVNKALSGNPGKETPKTREAALAQIKQEKAKGKAAVKIAKASQRDAYENSPEKKVADMERMHGQNQAGQKSSSFEDNFLNFWRNK